LLQDFNIKVLGNPLKSNVCVSSMFSTVKQSSVTRQHKKKV